MAVATDPTTTFQGFSPDAIQFLAELAQNNRREWFQARKRDYERLLKMPMEELCVALEQQFRSRDIPLHADPAKSPFRIYRDVRFSKDKSPYKTAAAASFGWAGDGVDAASGRSHSDNVHASGGYFPLQPGEIFVGGGVWHPDGKWLNGFRQRILADHAGFLQVIEAPAFASVFGGIGDEGDSLRRMPTGFPADHPAADLLRKKNVTFGRRLADSEAMTADLPRIIADDFAA